MGLFSHKKKDVIVGPSGYEYDAEPDVETRSPRRSVDSSHQREKEQERERLEKEQAERERERTGRASGEDVRAASGPTSSGAVPAAAAASSAAAAVTAAEATHRHTAGAATTTPAGTQPRSSIGGDSLTTSPSASTSPVTGRGVIPPGRGEKIVETAHPPHSHPTREADSLLSPEDAQHAEHDHKYLEPVIHERRHVHHVEEIERHRTVERHVHHVQHHLQPIIDEVHTEAVTLFREVPVTHIKENHAASAEEKALFDRLNIGPSTTTIIPHDKVVVDKGETMRTEHIIHHVHHIVQPIWQRDLHEYFRLNPPNPAAPAPYSTTYTGPHALGTSYYPPTQPQAGSLASAPNPASIAVQHGQAPSVGGSVPQGVTKEGHRLVPIEGSRHELNFVNREPTQTYHEGRTEVFPTRHEASPVGAHQGAAPGRYPATSSTTVPGATPLSPSAGARDARVSTGSAGAYDTTDAEAGMRNLSVGGIAK
ncbi:hypothetical protein JCM10212_005047 [Sporobolomyces blumeae]